MRDFWRNSFGLFLMLGVVLARDAALCQLDNRSVAPPEVYQSERLVKGYRLINQGDLAAARSELENVIRRDDAGKDLHPAETWVLSQYYFYAFENEKANRLARALLALDVTDYAEDRLLEMVIYSTDRLKGFKKVSEDGISIYYDHPKDRVLVDGAIDVLRKMRNVFSEAWGYRPKGDVHVVIVPGFEDFVKMSTLRAFEVDTSGTIGLCKFNRILLTSPRATLMGYPWKDTLAHEFVHDVVHAISGDAVPIWFHEGVARFHESLWRSDRGGHELTAWEAGLLKQRLAHNALVTFEQMSPSMAKLKSAEDAALAFAEVEMAVAYIRETCGGACIQSILAASGGSEAKHAFEKAFQAVLKMSVKDFEKKLTSHLKTLSFHTLPGLEIVRPQYRHGEKKDKAAAEKKRKAVSKRVIVADRMRDRKRPLAAARMYERALKETGSAYEPSILTKVGNAYLEAGRSAEALATFRRILAAYPANAPAWEGVGDAVVGTRDDEALQAFGEAIAINPFNPNTYQKMRGIYEKQKALELVKKMDEIMALLATGE